MIDVFRLTEAMKDLWGASGTEKEKRERLFNFKQDIQQVFICRKLMPCPFTGPKMFCAGSNFLSQPKHLTAFSASSKTFVPAQKPNLLNANHLFV